MDQSDKQRLKTDNQVVNQINHVLEHLATDSGSIISGWPNAI